jgi:hypothetical protein
MVDTSDKIHTIIRDYIEPGHYFTINRARQYGKTTTLFLLRRALMDTDIVLDLDFQSLAGAYESTGVFAGVFADLVARSLKQSGLAGPDITGPLTEPITGHRPFTTLSDRITDLCRAFSGRIVLLIDEVDRASDYDVFAAFLAMLREKYLERDSKAIPTFHSVILAGVHDIKNLRRKMRPDSEHSYNSPWNIAVPFTVDLSLSTGGIAGMLDQYEADHHTGMDTAAVAATLRDFTAGYPFLVSRLCEIIHQENLAWTPGGVEEALRRLLKEKNTLFDDAIKNLQYYPGLAAIVEAIVFGGETVLFDAYNPDIDLGIMYGLLREGDGGGTAITSIVFETLFSNYLASVATTRALVRRPDSDPRIFIHDGRLDLELALTRFAEFMWAEYRDEDIEFIQRQARLIFLAFIRGIINGAGFYYVEPETRASTRMDVVVVYAGEEHIVELKTWRGPADEQASLAQLAGYLDARGQDHGYLVNFTANRTNPRPARTVEHGGRRITEVTVAYRARTRPDD